VRFISRRRTGAAEAGIAKIVAALTAPPGSVALFLSPAPAGSEKTLLAILTTVQCHQPLPVGASGSRTVTAKLRVPAGAFFHASCGETLPPVQPKPANQCWARLPVMHIIAAHAKRRGHRATAHCRDHRHGHADTCFHRLLLVGVRKQGMRVRTS
jgi:hypothetical protein